MIRGFWVPGALALCAGVMSPIVAEPLARQSPRAATLVPAMIADPCAGRARCTMAGPFVAEVSRFSSSRSGKRQVVYTTVTFTNLGGAPIVLGYKARSGSVVDDAGNRYANEGNDRHRVSGIGYVTPNSADPQLVLGPGQSRSATFESWLPLYRGTKIGSVWSYQLTIDLLEILPNHEVRPIREIAVTFKDLTLTS